MKLTKEIIAKLEKEGFEIKEETICTIVKKVTLNSITDLNLEMKFNYRVEDFPNGDNSIHSETVFTVLKNGKVYDPKYERCQIEDIAKFLEKFFASSKKENKPIVIQVNENTMLVALQNDFPFDKEIDIFLGKKENGKYIFSQDIARISPDWEYVKEKDEDKIIYNKNLISAYFYGDKNDEDYTDEFQIDII